MVYPHNNYDIISINVYVYTYVHVYDIKAIKKQVVLALN